MITLVPSSGSVKKDTMKNYRITLSLFLKEEIDTLGNNCTLLAKYEARTSYKLALPSIKTVCGL